jgi:Ca-activated chloride channel homolog
MTNTSFEFDWTAFWLSLAFGACFYIFRRWSKQFSPPRVFYSNVKGLEFQKKSFKALGSHFPKVLEYAALLLFVIAFIDPRFYIQKPLSGELPPEEALEGIAIYFVLDQSGSMAESVEVDRGKSLPKVEILKTLTSAFIKGDPTLGLSGRPNDMIGLIAFARVPQVLSPLTLEHKAILKQLAAFDSVHDKNWDGTGIGYAIYKTAHLIAATRHFAQDLAVKGKPAYDIKNTIMILVTDGLQEANPLDLNNPLRTMDIPDAAAYAKEQGIRLYIVNLEPKLATEELAPFRHQMQKAAALTGGDFFFVNGSTNLLQIYSEIDRLEKSKLPWTEEQALSKDMLPQLYQKISLYPYLVALGMLFLIISIGLNATVMRKVP